MNGCTRTSGGMLLVTVDRLPAWMLPAHGCTWTAMPAVATLAARGLVCDRLISGSDDANAVIATLAGGGADDGTWPLLAAAGEAGWHPTVVTDDESLPPRLPAGVTVRTVPAAATIRTAVDAAETDLGRLFDVATGIVTSRAARFLWCHAAGLARSWDAPAEFRAAYVHPDDPPPPAGAAVPDVTLDDRADPDLAVGLRHVFAGQLTLLDACLGTLLDAVAHNDDGRPWTVLVAGVRGLGLGLHGRIGCGPLPPYGELVHLPAVLADHRGRMAAQRYGGILLPTDIAATLLELAGGRPAAGDDPRVGRSLAGLLDSWSHRDRDRAICVTSHGTAVATPAWHLVLPAEGAGREPVARLHAKPDDYFEACDVADRCPDVAAELTAIARGAGDDPIGAWTTPLSAAATAGL